MDGGIEPLDMAHLEHAAGSPRGPEQRIRFSQAGCDRLFNQEMDAVAEQGNTQRGVQAGRNGEAGGVYPSRKR
jgi:hypothetical protein